jgi:hypothetical protein
MRIEVEPGIAVSAKTVGELRKITSWPENLMITTPQERHSESVVRRGELGFDSVFWGRTLSEKTKQYQNLILALYSNAYF